MEKNYVDCENEYSLLEKRLERSESLVSGLSSSKDSWASKIEEIQNQVQFTYGNSILVSMSLSYFGPFSAEFWEEILEKTQLKLKEK